MNTKFAVVEIGATVTRGIEENIAEFTALADALVNAATLAYSYTIDTVGDAYSECAGAVREQIKKMLADI